MGDFMLRELFDQKPEIKKIILIILLIIVTIIIGLAVFPMFKSTKLTYSELEDKMQEAAISYYEYNEDKLPSDGNTVTISYGTLEKAGKIKAIDKYGKGSCEGKVVVSNSNNNYAYTAYLDCGTDYKTIKFYNKVLEDNQIVSEKDGLYLQGNSKVFRGEEINNFVMFDFDEEQIWRIIKIEGDNSVKLILYNGRLKSNYDDRYNSDRDLTVGKNDYTISRMKETMEELYSEDLLITGNLKGKMLLKPICIGKRSDDDNINDGSIECSKTIEGQYISNLSLYEYINASIDSACNSVNTLECQNYNYLNINDDFSSWWLTTAYKENSYQAYYVTSSGLINTSYCSSILTIKPTIYLSENTIYVSGNGSYDDPYIIK